MDVKPEPSYLSHAYIVDQIEKCRRVNPRRSRAELVRPHARAREWFAKTQ